MGRLQRVPADEHRTLLRLLEPRDLIGRLQARSVQIEPPEDYGESRAARSVTLSRLRERVAANRRGEGVQRPRPYPTKSAPHPNPLPRALSSMARESLRAGRGSPPSSRHRFA